MFTQGMLYSVLLHNRQILTYLLWMATTVLVLDQASLEPTTAHSETAISMTSHVQWGRGISGRNLHRRLSAESWISGRAEATWWRLDGALRPTLMSTCTAFPLNHNALHDGTKMAPKCHILHSSAILFVPISIATIAINRVHHQPHLISSHPISSSLCHLLISSHNSR